MRISVLISIVATIQVSAMTYSQSTRISLNVKDVDIRDAFREIERNSGLSFLYYENVLDLKKTVSVDVKNSSVPDLLDELLQNTELTYKILDNKFIVISPVNVMQQKITGTVTDASSGEPLPGVSILIVGTTTGVISDINGKYSIDIPSPNSVLAFSYVGYLSEEITFSGQTTIDIKLSPDIKKLDEVVVVGYGTQKRVNLTGSISSINGGELDNKPVSLTAALQGMASGVTVIQSSGQPGADQGTIRIRGIGTINNADPLVIVDGFETDINTFNNINANDIESMSILKDAASSSIYGLRAANGVILVTTKRGEKNKTRVAYSFNAGWQRPTFVPDFVGAQEYMKLTNLTLINSGGAAKYSAADIAAYNDPKRNTDLYPDVNWMKEILKGNGFQQEHNLSVSSGNERSRYRFSTSYADQGGLVKKMDFNRITARLNTDFEISKRLNFSADVSAISTDRTEPQGNGGGAWFQFQQAIATNPLWPVKYSDGTWGPGRGDGNPVRLQQEGGLYDYKNKQIAGNFRADFKLFEGLTLSGLVSVNYMTFFNNMHDVALTYTDFFTKATSTKMTDDVTNQFTSIFNTNYQALANYNKTFGKHSIKLLAGVARQEYT
ncbi:MAG TPA: SusC/RagA family TonB-linked outer membrane protein, partial [Bacteroidales bacterium]